MHSQSFKKERTFLENAKRMVDHLLVYVHIPRHRITKAAAHHSVISAQCKVEDRPSVVLQKTAEACVKDMM